MSIHYGQYQKQVMAWAKPGDAIIRGLSPRTAHLFHMAAAILGEAVELKMAVALSDEKNIFEELGDLVFYWAGMDDVISFADSRQSYGNVSAKKISESNKTMAQIENLPDITDRILQTCGEVFDCIKKAAIYEQEPDLYRYSLFGCYFWVYLIPEIATMYGWEVHELYNGNYEKLSERMGTIYSNEAAQLRADKQ